MALFLLCFIVFIIWFRVKMKQNKSELSEQDKLFWEREERANFAKKQDISNLNYFQPDLSALPFKKDADEAEQRITDEVRRYAAEKMINLSGFSNTDLKEQYGAANLDTLSECDQRYALFIHALSNWSNYLYETEDYKRAKKVMRYSIEIGSDISTIYINLGNILAKEGSPEKIDALITLVEKSDFALKQSILKKLHLCRLEC